MAVFDRIEYKYVLTREMADRFFAACGQHLIPDRYGDGDGLYFISSLYFDDAAHSFFFQTLDRAPYREKLRLRIYGAEEHGENLTDDTTAFFEIKRKLCGRSIKKRLSLPLADAETLAGGTLPEISDPEASATASEILGMIRRFHLLPSAVVSYRRQAFLVDDTPSLRITFDSRLTIRADHLSLREGTYGTPVMSPDTVVLEIKCNQNLPLWLSLLLAEEKLCNAGYSKYCHLGALYENGIPPRIDTANTPAHSAETARAFQTL